MTTALEPWSFPRGNLVFEFDVCFSLPLCFFYILVVCVCVCEIISLDDTMLCGFLKLRVCLKHFLLAVYREDLPFYELYSIPWYGLLHFIYC